MVHCSTQCRIYVHSGADAMYVFFLPLKAVPGPKCQRIPSSLFPRTSLTPFLHTFILVVRAMACTDGHEKETELVVVLSCH